jgi:6-phosphogluconolactonase (cycloisomerase 2 family)
MTARRETRRYRAATTLAAAVVLGLAVVSGAGAGTAAVGGLTFERCIEDNDAAPDECAPAFDGLNSPREIAVSPDLRSVYVVSGSDSALVRLDRDRVTGDLTFGQCFDDDTSGTEAACPPVPALAGAEDVLVSPDGRFVYALSPNNHAISRFSRNPATGAIAYQGCLEEMGGAADCAQSAPVLETPAAFSLSADGHSLYVVDDSFGINAVIRFDRNVTTGALTYAQCIDDDGDCPTMIAGLDQPSDVEVAPDGRQVYVVGSNDEAVTRFTRNGASGAISRAQCLQQSGGSVPDCEEVDGLASVEYVEASADGRSVYLAGYELARLDRNRATGALSFGQCFRSDAGFGACAPVDGLDQLFGLALSPDDRSVLTVAGAGNAIHNYDRNPASGALTLRQCFDDEDTGTSTCTDVPGLSEPGGVTVSGDGRSVYTAAHLDDAIGVFDRVPLRCRGRAGTVYGTPFRDALAGTAAPDVFIALGGPDTTTLKGGKDVACGGSGRDRLRGGAGADLLLGEGGGDLLIGGKGRDRLLGGKGRDRLRGGPARDKLRGGPGRDRQRQ